MSGLLVDGVQIEVPGVLIVNEHDQGWAHLSREDGTARVHYPQFLVLHKTKADDPEKVEEGFGPPDSAKHVAEVWADDPLPSAAQLVVSWDYAVCLCDVVKMIAWNARAANYLGIGIEHYEELGGGVRRQTLENGFLIERALCAFVGIQYQVPKPPWKGPLARFANGGRDLVGLFGHRDVDNTRSRWDPGDAIFGLHTQAGAESFDFAAKQDLDVWSERQGWINQQGDFHLAIDGVPGRMTTAALKQLGYVGGVWAFGRKP